MPTASDHNFKTSPPRRDTRAAPSSVRWGRDVPEAIQALSELVDADYADIVTATLEKAPSTTPDQLVHAALSGLPRSLLAFVPFVQRAVLGLRLHLRASPDHLLGWKISGRGENWIRIEAASWFLSGRIVMHLDDKRISFATFVRYDRRIAAFVWPPISLIHRQVAIALVRSAIRAQ